MGISPIIIISLVLLCAAVCIDAQANPPVSDSNVHENSSLNQCFMNEDCPQNLTCMYLACGNPCLQFCKGNSNCQVRDHVTVCSCKPGFSGDPLSGCNELTSQIQYQCTQNDECPQNQTCIDHECKDPCVDVCRGNNTICHVSQHVPYCSCKPGYSGDPLSACRLQYPPGSWPPYQGGKKRYKVENIKTNWYTAFAQCMNHGGRLATIMNEEENEAIKAVIQNSGINDDFWTSGSDYAVDEHFTWMSTGLPFTFSDWGTGQPDSDYEEHCMELWKNINYQWNDCNCFQQQYSICEYYD